MDSSRYVSLEIAEKALRALHARSPRPLRAQRQLVRSARRHGEMGRIEPATADIRPQASICVAPGERDVEANAQPAAVRSRKGEHALQSRVGTHYSTTSPSNGPGQAQ